MQDLILVAEYNSSGIKEIAELVGAKYLKFIGSGYTDNNPNNPNSLIEFYSLVSRSGENFFDIRVADTSGEPIWEDEDSQAFADLAEQCGVELD